jgi:hypothetical protein
MFRTGNVKTSFDRVKVNRDFTAIFLCCDCGKLSPVKKEITAGSRNLFTPFLPSIA